MLPLAAVDALIGQRAVQGPSCRGRGRKRRLGRGERLELRVAGGQGVTWWPMSSGQRAALAGGAS